jgi:hypothetical protein
MIRCREAKHNFRSYIERNNQSGGSCQLSEVETVLIEAGEFLVHEKYSPSTLPTPPQTTEEIGELL